MKFRESKENKFEFINNTYSFIYKNIKLFATPLNHIFLTNYYFTFKDGQHVPHITLTYQHEGQRVYIDLHRNDELLPAKHFLRYQNSTSPTGRVVKNFTKTEMELCHYQVSCAYNKNVVVKYFRFFYFSISSAEYRFLMKCINLFFNVLGHHSRQAVFQCCHIHL